MIRGTTLVSGLIAVLLLSSGATAEDRAPSPYSQEREGFLIGFSLGFGATFPCDTCADFGAEFHVGAMASPRLSSVRPWALRTALLLMRGRRP